MSVRKSYTSPKKIYFWTATIHKWLPLLNDDNKNMIIDYLKDLSTRGLIKVYGFVIMPNHVHFIWSLENKNGKETAKGSFLKYTAHVLLKKLKVQRIDHLVRVNKANKLHEIWQRDSLAIELYTRSVAIQKLNYVHANPVRGKWKLSKDDIAYPFSSALYYETGVDNFGFLNDLYEYFDGK